MATVFVLLNDLHLYRGPVTRLDDYEGAIFNKLEQVKKLAMKTGAVAVCIAGDFFHSKVKVPYATTIRLMEWALELRALGIAVLGIAGNHDLQHDRLESLQTQPLGLLFKCGAITDVAYAAVEFDDVVVTGVPYPDALDLGNFARVPASARRHGLILAHCFALPERGDYFDDPVHAYADLFTRAPYSVVHLGHDHRDHGVTQLPGDRYAVNLGAVSRGSLSADEAHRVVKVAVVTFGATATVQQVKLAIAPFDEVFDVSLHEQKVRSRHDIELFVADLSARLDATGPVDLRARLEALALTAEVRTRVLDYLTHAEAEVN